MNILPRKNLLRNLLTIIIYNACDGCFLCDFFQFCLIFQQVICIIDIELKSHQALWASVCTDVLAGNQFKINLSGCNSGQDFFDRKITAHYVEWNIMRKRIFLRIGALVSVKLNLLRGIKGIVGYGCYIIENQNCCKARILGKRLILNGFHSTANYDSL